MGFCSPYGHNTLCYSVMVTTGLTLGLQLLKFLPLSSTKGILFTPNFHPPFSKLCIRSRKEPIFLICCPLGLLAPPSGSVGISPYVIEELSLFCISCIGSHLADVVYRILPTGRLLRREPAWLTLQTILLRATTSSLEMLPSQ